MPRYLTADVIINRAALEVGLLPATSPVSSTDEAFIQLTGLLTGAGQELCELNPWQILVREYTINTDPLVDGISGVYDLPADFNYMIDQTGWDQGNNLPVGGPLSAQDWTYLAGRDLASQTIYASFRVTDGKVDIYPNPPPTNMLITFEYISRNWLKEQGEINANRDDVGAGSDICMLDPQLTIKFLKLKFLQAKGFDPTAAGLEFDTMLGGRIGKSTGAAILSASNSGRAFPYLTPYGNTPDTGYGSF
jgi:hypothetical protein